MRSLWVWENFQSCYQIKYQIDSDPARLSIEGMLLLVVLLCPAWYCHPLFFFYRLFPASFCVSILKKGSYWVCSKYNFMWGHATVGCAALPSMRLSSYDFTFQVIYRQNTAKMSLMINRTESKGTSINSWN